MSQTIAIDMEPLNQMPYYTLFGVKNPEYKDAKVVVLPVPYDSATTYKPGARDGPHAIIDASRNMEMYNEEFDADITGIGIYTCEELSPNLNSPRENVERIEKEVERILEDSKIPLIIGGDHSVSIGSIRALGKRTRDFSVIHFDAHSDSRDEYMGSKFCHACVTARAREVCSNVLSIGVRSTDEEGAHRYGKEILFRKEMHGMSIDEVVETAVKRTKKKVYITIDVDVLDPSEMPSTGTPEPDGLRYHELASILKGFLKRKELIGLDFTELSPIGGIVAPNYLVAKLIYVTLGYAYYVPKTP